MAIENWVYMQFDSVLPYKDTDLKVPCPFCSERVGSPDHGHHLHISIVKDTAHCFRCDYGSSHVNLIRAVTGCSYGEAVAETNTSVGVLKFNALYAVPNAKAVEEKPFDMNDSFISIADARNVKKGYIYKACQLVTRYLRRRGFSIDTLDYYGIGIWSHAAGYGKIVIPVERGFWQERSVFPNTPKYMSAKMPKEDRLFNWRALDMCDHVLIAEGAFSAMSILTRNAVALIGKKATPEQVARLIKAQPSHYTIALDADALENAMELADVLSRGGKTVTLRSYEKGDPNSCDVFEERCYGWDARVELALRR